MLNLKALFSPWWQVPIETRLLQLFGAFEYYQFMQGIKESGYDFRVSFHAWHDNKPAPIWYVQAWVPKRVKETQITFQASSILEGLALLSGKIKEITLDH